MENKVVISLFLIALAALVALITQATGGITYGLDDAYIHLSMARTLREHGTWGIAAGEFAPASSSLLWTMLLSLFAGSRELLVWTPLILNALFSCALLALFSRQMSTLSSCKRFLALATVALCIPLPLLTLGGMEHVLHALLCCLFMLAFQAKLGSGSRSCSLCILALLLTATRYESFFIILPAALCLFVLRDKLTAVLLILSAITPTVVFGAISVRAGWFFLPSTLVLTKNIALARFILSANMSGILPALTELLRPLL
ncbi:MAG: hypothetical protein K1X79_10125, partial [Oligoflexia bacterium]|nr:hypothetical protein [Oligoflexia bacterium]